MEDHVSARLRVGDGRERESRIGKLGESVRAKTPACSRKDPSAKKKKRRRGMPEGGGSRSGRGCDFSRDQSQGQALTTEIILVSLRKPIPLPKSSSSLRQRDSSFSNSKHFHSFTNARLSRK